MAARVNIAKPAVDEHFTCRFYAPLCHSFPAFTVFLMTGNPGKQDHSVHRISHSRFNINSTDKIDDIGLAAAVERKAL